MAVADVAVAMGPRNQRRVVSGSIALALVAGVAALGHQFLPSSHPGSSSFAGLARVPAPMFVTDRIVYGMTKAEVLRRIGPPTQSVGPCWQYDENEKIRGGENTLDAQRVCFLSGIYSYDYPKVDGRWNDPTTPLKVPSHLG
jgi:hypothetical protein